MATDQIRVVVVDGDGLFRCGLVLLLGREPDIEVVGQAADGPGAVQQATELVPDLVLMELHLRHCSGAQACRAIRHGHPQTRVLFLTGSEDEDDLFEAIRSGAAGYLLKSTDPELLLGAVRALASGGALVQGHLATRLLAAFSRLLPERPGRPAVRASPEGTRLTPREAQLLPLLVGGWSNARIAAHLAISENTVKTHVSSLLRKLHAHSRRQVAHAAPATRLLPDGDLEEAT